MAAPELDDRRVRDGDALLTALDTAGVQVRATFWNYTSSAEEWRLVIVTPQIETKGPKSLFRLAYKILTELQKPSFILFDVDFESLHSVDLMVLIRNLPLGGMRTLYVGIRTNELTIESMFLYFTHIEQIALDNNPSPRLAAE